MPVSSSKIRCRPTGQAQQLPGLRRGHVFQDFDHPEHHGEKCVCQLAKSHRPALSRPYLDFGASALCSKVMRAGASSSTCSVSMACAMRFSVPSFWSIECLIDSWASLVSALASNWFFSWTNNCSCSVRTATCSSSRPMVVGSRASFLTCCLALGIPAQEQNTQGWQSQTKRVRPAVRGNGVCADTSCISQTAASVDVRITV